MPAVEPLVVSLQGTKRDTGLDVRKLIPLGEHLEKIVPKYQKHLATNKLFLIDVGVLAHQIPGGMISNLVSQLKGMNALDRLNEVHAEIPRTRKDAGTPPLVTPTSQIVGVQAVTNVVAGRYKMVTNQFKDLIYGLYGKTPTPIDPEVQKLVLKHYKRGQTPVTGPPAYYLEPELAEDRKKIGDLAKNDEDLLIYALYPATGEQFLKWKYGIEPMPENMKPPQAPEETTRKRPKESRFQVLNH
jgi:pyruvate/oxaloacetate carboxyltransferase